MIGLRPQMSSAVSGIVLLLAVWAIFPVSAVDHVQVRVRQTPGGPQIFIDGKPTPPHMFWGREIVAPQRVTGGWRTFCLPHTPAATIEKAEVRFKLDDRVLGYVSKDGKPCADKGAYRIWIAPDAKGGKELAYRKN